MLDRTVLVTGNAPVLVDDTGLTVHAWNGLPDDVQVFQGTADGSLATEPRGTAGLGYDSIFIPDSDASQRTYAQRRVPGQR